MIEKKFRIWEEKTGYIPTACFDNSQQVTA